MKHLMHKPGMTSLEDGSPEPPFWERYVSRTVKNNLVAALSEFVGTTMFLLIAFGGTVCPPTLFCHTGSLANRYVLLRLTRPPRSECRQHPRQCVLAQTLSRPDVAQWR
jgi:hypothetical protein